MASLCAVFQYQSVVKNTALAKPSFFFSSSFLPRNLQFRRTMFDTTKTVIKKTMTANVVTTVDQEQKKNMEKGFVEEMRMTALRMHSKEQSKEGQKETETPEERPVGLWEPNLDGYLNYLVATRLVHTALEHIIDRAAFPIYVELKKTGLERSERLVADLKWVEEQGYELPETSSAGETYSDYLKNVSEKDPQAFLCHYYNVYFGLSAGGRMIGKKVREKLFQNKEFEFYKWDGDLSELMQNVRVKLNNITQGWTREEKERCLHETQTSFEYSKEILRLMLS